MKKSSRTLWVLLGGIFCLSAAFVRANGTSSTGSSGGGIAAQDPVTGKYRLLEFVERDRKGQIAKQKVPFQPQQQDAFKLLEAKLDEADKKVPGIKYLILQEMAKIKFHFYEDNIPPSYDDCMTTSLLGKSQAARQLGDEVVIQQHTFKDDFDDESQAGLLLHEILLHAELRTNPNAKCTTNVQKAVVAIFDEKAEANILKNRLQKFFIGMTLFKNSDKEKMVAALGPSVNKVCANAEKYRKLTKALPSSAFMEIMRLIESETALGESYKKIEHILGRNPIMDQKALQLGGVLAYHSGGSVALEWYFDPKRITGNAPIPENEPIETSCKEIQHWMSSNVPLVSNFENFVTRNNGIKNEDRMNHNSVIDTTVVDSATNQAE